MPQTRTIFLSDLRNRNDISLYGEYCRTIPMYFNLSGGGLINAVIKSVSFSFKECCTVGSISFSFSLGDDILSFPVPYTGPECHIRSSQTVTVPVSGWSNSSFSIENYSCVGSMSGFPSNKEGTSMWFEGAYFTVEYDEAQSSFVVPSIVTVGEPFNVTISAGSDYVDHIIGVGFGDYYFDTFVSHESGKKTYVNPITIPEEWLSAIPNSINGTGTVSVSTVYGTYEATERKSITVVPSFTSGPYITNIVAASTKASCMAPDDFSKLNNLFYKDLTGVSASMFAQGRYGAEVVSTRIEVVGMIDPGFVVNVDSPNANIVTPPLPNYGDIIIKYSAKDTRGVTSTINKTISVSKYNHPTLSKFIIERANKTGILVPNGKLCKCSLYFVASSVNPISEDVNSLAYKIFYKIKSDQISSDYVQCFLDKTNQGLLCAKDGTPIEFNVAYAYSIKVVLTDIGGDVEYISELSSSNFVRAVDKSLNSQSFGMTPQHANSFEISDDYEIYVHGMTLKEYIQKVVAGMI